MALKLLLHVPQVLGESVGAFGAAAMNLLDPAGQADQLGELVTVTFVEARQQVVDQLARGHVAPVPLRFLRLEGKQRLGDDLGLDADTPCGLAQREIAAAAEVQAIVAEDAGGSRQRAGEVAEGLVDKVCAHDNVPDDDDRAIATGVPSLEAPKIANCSTPLVKITRAGYGSENLEGN